MTLEEIIQKYAWKSIVLVRTNCDPLICRVVARMDNFLVIIYRHDFLTLNHAFIETNRIEEILPLRNQIGIADDQVIIHLEENSGFYQSGCVKLLPKPKEISKTEVIDPKKPHKSYLIL